MITVEALGASTRVWNGLNDETMTILYDGMRGYANVNGNIEDSSYA